MLSSTFKSQICVLETYLERMEIEKSCSLAKTVHYSFPIYDSNLFFNVSLSKTPTAYLPRLTLLILCYQVPQNNLCVAVVS